MSNSVSRSYPKDNQDTSLREETLCSCPPETSPLDEVGGGILARHALLSETVVGTSEIPLPDCLICHEPVDIDQFNFNAGVCNFCHISAPICDCGSTFYRDDLGSCYDCFFPSDDRGE